MNVGDKIIVVEVAAGFEEDYAIGDVFEVHSFFDEDEDIIVATNGMEFYDWEVEPYDEDAEYAAKDADVSTWVKEEEIDEYNEIVIGLSQAIAMKASQMRGEDADGDIPKGSIAAQFDGKELAGSLWTTVQPGHIKHECTIETEVEKVDVEFPVWGEEGSEWEDMEPVGKEIIYDDYNPDSVEHPSHYTQGTIEVIDIIAQTVSGYDDGFTAHCVGTATKYLNRAPHKHETPLEDLKKAAKYLEFAIKHEEKKSI